jgi:hypothetical protein
MLTTSERTAIIDEPVAIRDVADDPEPMRESGGGSGGGVR